MKPGWSRIGAGVLLVCTAVWVLDEASFRLNLPRRELYGTVHVEHYKVVTEKFNLTSWDRLTPEEKRCVHALLPHGFEPCWYVERHRTDVRKVG